MHRSAAEGVAWLTGVEKREAKGGAASGLARWRSAVCTCKVCLIFHSIISHQTLAIL